MKTKFKIVLLTVVLINVGVTTFALATYDPSARCTGSKSCSACKKQQALQALHLKWKNSDYWKDN